MALLFGFAVENCYHRYRLLLW